MNEFHHLNFLALRSSDEGLKNSHIQDPHFKYMENSCVIIIYQPYHGFER